MQPLLSLWEHLPLEPWTMSVWAGNVILGSPTEIPCKDALKLQKARQRCSTSPTVQAFPAEAPDIMNQDYSPSPFSSQF